MLGKPAPEPRPQDVIVVAVMEDKPFGLLVDGVSDIVEIDGGSITRSGEEAWSSHLVEGIARVGEQLVPLLSLHSLAGEKLSALPAAA
jgi:purine-binding chemotaxis protein CheW